MVRLSSKEMRFRIPRYLLEVEPQILGARAFSFWYVEGEFRRVDPGARRGGVRFFPQEADVTPLSTIAFTERRYRLGTNVAP